MNSVSNRARIDAHARPPEALRALFKKWQKAQLTNIEADEVLDMKDLSHTQQTNARISSHEDARYLKLAFHEFLGDCGVLDETKITESLPYSVDEIPGLYIYPALLPCVVQVELLDKLFHRDLSNPEHKTNLHLHYDISYPTLGHDGEATQQSTSFFKLEKHTILEPKDSEIHKPLNVEQMLQRKLRWMTLGGQYDWTAKVYPNEKPPEFPSDISRLLKQLFPELDAQAAIVNIYTPGDTLSLHRDVSEECDRGLVSVSIGCDGLFLIGTDDGNEAVVIRLRSGDAVLMSGKSRFAWHGVPRIIPNTCPDEISDWPALSRNGEFSQWQSWLSNKRINLNVRQMTTLTERLI